MKRFLKALGAVLLATLLLFSLLEGTFLLLGFPPGAKRYIEEVVIREGLTVKKAAGEFRIFAFGESTMHGSIYWPVSNLTIWLKTYLKDFLPSHKIRVVNFARMGEESLFIEEALRDTLAYQPDLLIFYLGHNEFLHGNLEHQVRAEQSGPGHLARQLVCKSRLISAVYRRLIGLRMKRKSRITQDRMEYEVIETGPRGIGVENATPRNGPVYQEEVRAFRKRIFRIADLAARKKIPTVFFKPVSNLKDFAPFYSLHLRKLAPTSLSSWERHFEAGRKAEKENRLEEALGHYEEAYAIDPTYAELSFRLGRIRFERGELPEARRLFEEARDNDAIIFRATGDILEVYDELAGRREFEMIDTEAAVASRLPGGILGEPVIEDNVHFSPEGQSLVARALARQIAKRGWIAPASEWRFERQRPFEAMAGEIGITPEVLISAYLKMVVYFGSRFENRVRFAEKALGLDPGSPDTFRHLAWSYWLMGEKEKALETYRRLGEIAPESLQEVFRTRPEIQEAFVQGSSQALSREKNLFPPQRASSQEI